MIKKEKEYILELISKNPNSIDEAINLAEIKGLNDLLNDLHKLNNQIELKTTNFDRNLFLPNKIRNEIFSLRELIGKKMIFYGRPGTGKSEAAKLLGHNFGLEAREINSYDVISSNLGESLRNLKSLIFNDVNEKELIIIDEIDGLINNRDEINESQEIHRLTSGMMNIFDNLPKTKAIIFTTNYINKIDAALLRRFDFVVNFDIYTDKDITEIFTKSIRNSKIVKEIAKEDNYLSKRFLEKKYFNFILKNSDGIPSKITSSISKTDKYFEETNILNLSYLFENFIELKNLKDIVHSLKSNEFTQNEIFRILKNSFDFTAHEIKKEFSNEEHNKKQ